MIGSGEVECLPTSRLIDRRILEEGDAVRQLQGTHSSSGVSLIKKAF